MRKVKLIFILCVICLITGCNPGYQIIPDSSTEEVEQQKIDETSEKKEEVKSEEKKEEIKSEEKTSEKKEDKTIDEQKEEDKSKDTVTEETPVEEKKEDSKTEDKTEDKKEDSQVDTEQKESETKTEETPVEEKKTEDEPVQEEVKPVEEKKDTETEQKEEVPVEEKKEDTSVDTEQKEETPVEEKKDIETEQKKEEVKPVEEKMEETPVEEKKEINWLSVDKNTDKGTAGIAAVYVPSSVENPFSDLIAKNIIKLEFVQNYEVRTDYESEYKHYGFGTSKDEIVSKVSMYKVYLNEDLKEDKIYLTDDSLVYYYGAATIKHRYVLTKSENGWLMFTSFDNYETPVYDVMTIIKHSYKKVKIKK